VVIIKAIRDFTEKLGSSISFDENYLINKNGRIFLLNDKLNKYPTNFFYAGLFLGKIRIGKIVPSLRLLAILSKNKANKIILNNKSAWLFICGKDINLGGIIRSKGSLKKGDMALVLNCHGDCLGLGKIISNIDKTLNKKIFLKNLLDIGNFLRREK
jgi:ribosome biogenesis protein Nip4